MTANLPFITPETAAEASSFKAQQGDIMIVTYPKCGTTWCQQLCHQLRTGGHTDFEEISEESIVPWLEVSPGLGINLDAKQIAEPRCFKTHQMLSALSCFEVNGARYLCVLRDPEGALLSEFKFKLAKGRIETKDVNVFAKSHFLPRSEVPPTFGGHIWEFYAEFWQCRILPHVKLIAFEDLKQYLESQILPIAEFMGLPEPSPEVQAKVLELGSFAWMQKNDRLFDDHHMPARINRVKGKGKGEGKSDLFLQQGFTSKVGLQVGDDVNVKVTEETRALLACAWRDIVEPVSGHACYPDMVKALHEKVTKQ